MRYVACLAVCLAVFASGCQVKQLQRSTVTQSRSITDVYYDQILDNIAMLANDRAKLPYFSVPNTGQTSTQYSLNVNATSNLDLLAATSTVPAYLSKYVFDKFSGFATGGDTNIEQWNTKPTYDPDQILLMKYAYEFIFGDPTHYYYLSLVLNPELAAANAGSRKLSEAEKQERLKSIEEPLSGIEGDDADTVKITRLQAYLRDDGLGETWNFAPGEAEKFYGKLKFQNEPKAIAVMRSWAQDQLSEERRNRAIVAGLDAARARELPLLQFRPDYTQLLHTGWFSVGVKHDVPKGACHVGRCGKTYAWVKPGAEQALADFALVILDITTYQPPYRTPQSQATGVIGRAATR